MFKSILFLFIIFKIILLNHALAYTDTAKLIATTERAEFYIYTGSVKRVDKSSDDYYVTAVVNFKNNQSIKSYFQNMTLHCGDKTNKQMTLNTNVGHADLWANGAIMSDTSANVGKKMQLNSGTANEIIYNHVCASLVANLPSINTTKENSKQTNNASSETLEQQMQRQINERNLSNQRKNDIEQSKKLAYDKDIEVGIKYICNSNAYLFLRGVAYEGYNDWRFENIKRQLESKHGLNQVGEGNFKLESGVFKFNLINPNRYVEIHANTNIIYIRWSDQITKHSCEYRGGDLSRFNK